MNPILLNRPSALRTVPHSTAAHNPLRSLMEMWETDIADEEDAVSEMDVSVMLHSVVGQQFFASDQQ